MLLINASLTAVVHLCRDGPRSGCTSHDTELMRAGSVSIARALPLSVWHFVRGRERERRRASVSEGGRELRVERVRWSSQGDTAFFYFFYCLVLFICVQFFSPILKLKK